MENTAANVTLLTLILALCTSNASASNAQFGSGSEQTVSQPLVISLTADAGRIRNTSSLIANSLPIVRGDDGRFAPRDDGIKRALLVDNKIAAENGGELTRSLANVLVDKHNLCRWVDNNDEDTDYFVPTGSAAEWVAFVANAPGKVRVDGCCPAKAVSLTASDGQSHTETLEVGRENSTGAFGRRQLRHDFVLTRVSDGASWTETVAADFVCNDGAWTSQGVERTGEAPEETATEAVTPACLPGPLAPIVVEGGSCVGNNNPAWMPTVIAASQGQGGLTYYDLGTGHSSVTYLPNHHCLSYGRNFNATVALPPVDLSAFDPTETSFKVRYTGHLPLGTRTIEFDFNPAVSGELFREGAATGKSHMTTISWNAATRQFVLYNQSTGWGNCKTIDCGGLVMPKLTIEPVRTCGMINTLKASSCIYLGPDNAGHRPPLPGDQELNSTSPQSGGPAGRELLAFGGEHCSVDFRNWGVKAEIDATSLPKHDPATQRLVATYAGNLPTGARTVEMPFDPEITSNLLIDAMNIGYSAAGQKTIITYDAPAKKFVLRAVSWGKGNCCASVKVATTLDVAVKPKP